MGAGNGPRRPGELAAERFVNTSDAIRAYARPVPPPPQGPKPATARGGDALRRKIFAPNTHTFFFFEKKNYLVLESGLAGW